MSEPLKQQFLNRRQYLLIRHAVFSFIQSPLINDIRVSPDGERQFRLVDHPDAVAARRIGFAYVDFNTLLLDSDVLSVHMPHNPQTHHLIDATALAAMKPTAVLINAARGGIVDA